MSSSNQLLKQQFQITSISPRGQWLNSMAFVYVIIFSESMPQLPRANEYIKAKTKWHFKCIFLIENICISINISLKFVPKGNINNIPALLQIIASCWPGDKPLSEPMIISLLTHICISQPQWVKGKLMSISIYHQFIKKKTSMVDHNKRKLYRRTVSAFWIFCPYHD